MTSKHHISPVRRTLLALLLSVTAATTLHTAVTAGHSSTIESAGARCTYARGGC